MVKIKVFKAQQGDAFLLQLDNKNILIDMGTVSTYECEIKQELIKLANLNQKIDLLIITHIDEDHIGGAIKFLEENKKNEIICIDEIWHNSYRHLQFNKQKVPVIDCNTNTILKMIIKQSQTAKTTDEVQNISCRQGSSFASLIYKYDYDWNSSFSNGVISVESKQEVEIGSIKFIFLSPNQNKLQKLSKKWLKELSKKKHDFEISDDNIFDDAFEFYMKFELGNDNKTYPISAKKNIDFQKLSEVEEQDNSVTNGSSIAFIIEYDNKKLLFLGDAHEDIVYDSLLKLNNTGYELVFDIVKISHHGSNKNISNGLVELTDSKKILFSTDGSRHNHPDIKAISKIIIKDTDYSKELFFNYDLDILKKLDDEELKIKHNYEIKYQSEIELL